MGELQVDALVRDAWGDVGHLTVFVRREDADPSRKWSATVFDHENRPLTTAHGSTKAKADKRAVEQLEALGYSPTGYAAATASPSASAIRRRLRRKRFDAVLDGGCPWVPRDDERRRVGSATGFRRLGGTIDIADARKVKAVAPLACKTDRVDAQVLAELARRDTRPRRLRALARRARARRAAAPAHAPRPAAHLGDQPHVRAAHAVEAVHRHHRPAQARRRRPPR